MKKSELPKGESVVIKIPQDGKEVKEKVLFEKEQAKKIRKEIEEEVREKRKQEKRLRGNRVVAGHIFSRAFHTSEEQAIKLADSYGSTIQRNTDGSYTVSRGDYSETRSLEQQRRKDKASLSQAKYELKKEESKMPEKEAEKVGAVVATFPEDDKQREKLTKEVEGLTAKLEDGLKSIGTIGTTVGDLKKAIDDITSKFSLLQKAEQKIEEVKLVPPEAKVEEDKVQALERVAVKLEESMTKVAQVVEAIKPISEKLINIVPGFEHAHDIQSALLCPKCSPALTKRVLAKLRDVDLDDLSDEDAEAIEFVYGRLAGFIEEPVKGKDTDKGESEPEGKEHDHGEEEEEEEGNGSGGEGPAATKKSKAGDGGAEKRRGGRGEAQREDSRGSGEADGSYDGEDDESFFI